MYYARMLGILISTALHAVVFITHRILSGNAETTYRYAQSWCRSLLRLSGVQVIIHGRENIQADTRYILLSNHASQFDVPAVNAIPLDLRMMYKEELRKIPFMGWALMASSYIPIVRSNARSAKDVLERTVSTINQSTASVLVFAEGTRSYDGSLLPFKRGGVQLAVKSATPILPVAIVGSYKILPRNSSRFNKGTIHVHIGSPIEVEKREYTRSEELELLEKVKIFIESKLDT
jgi:1-acyl-sn-glycerol-3-phosphate acyltransferase